MKYCTEMLSWIRPRWAAVAHVLAGVALVVVGTCWADPARIVYTTAAVQDTFAVGALLFTDRTYVLKELPTQLAGMRFLRAAITGVSFDVETGGELVVCTPQEISGAATQQAALERLGFARMGDVPLFQSFGDNAIDCVHTYRKTVVAGDHYDFGKWTIVMGFDPSSDSLANHKETLYNGVTLASDARGRSDMPAYRNYPLPVPYLDHPPEVIPVDVGRQLFVDDFLIAETTMSRVWHKPQKDARSPVLRPETPLERGELSGKSAPTEAMAAPFSGGVWYDGTDGLFKCFYCAGWFDGTAYAYSTNGFDWIRPSLRAVPGTNRLVEPTIVDGVRSYRDSAAVVMDPDAVDGKRFKMLIWSRPQGGELFVSENGTDWSAPVPWGNRWGDRSTIFYNPFRRMWVYSIRAGWSARSRDYFETRDFLAGATGTGAVNWLRADCRDQPEKSWIYCEPTNFSAAAQAPSLYNFDCVAYESLMLGAFTLMTGADNADCEARNVPKMTDLHLGFSRDGFHFSRSDDRTPFIAAARTAGAWDRGYLHSNAGVCLVDGDELRFYYTGFAGKTGAFANAPYSGLYSNASMGLAWLRRDGFASMDAPSRGATLVTRPLRFTVGDRLWVNANAGGGALAVELLDADGNVLAASEDWYGNATKAALLAGLSSYAGRTVRLRFTARDAQLYAFWFSDASGRSRGYLAGGAPGQSGLRDLARTDGTVVHIAETKASSH